METVPISPEVAAHIAGLLDVSTIEFPAPGTGFILLRIPDSESTERIKPIGQALSKMTGCIVLVMEHDVDLSALDEADMLGLGWMRIDG